MCNWILRLIWFIVKKSSSKSSLLLSNFSLSIVRRNWYFFFLGDGLSVTTCINFGSKSSLHFSNLLFSIVRRNWHFFFLSDCLSRTAATGAFLAASAFGATTAGLAAESCSGILALGALLLSRGVGAGAGFLTSTTGSAGFGSPFFWL